MPPAQRLSLALLVAACLAPLGVSAQLSPQAQRDLLEVRLLDRIKAEDHGNYLTLLSEYRQVGGLPGLEMRYYEAVALFNTKQAIPAHHVLSTFINAAGSSHPLYVEALSLFTKVETAANQARQKQADIEQFLTQAPKQCAESAAQAKLALQARGAGAAFRECPFAPEMVIIPGGTFRMAQDGNSIATLVPPTPFPVTVRGFAMGKHEVTHEEWEACIAGGGCPAHDYTARWGRGKHPVVSISWHEAVAYTEWLSTMTGQRYRLPSEAEWEYAARAGAPTAYLFGNTISQRHARFDTGDLGGTRPVGNHPFNPVGLHDVLGNAAELTLDCFEPGPPKPAPPTDGSPYLGGACTFRIVRGGHFGSTPYGVRLSSYWYQQPDWGYHHTGFRVVRELD